MIYALKLPSIHILHINNNNVILGLRVSVVTEEKIETNTTDVDWPAIYFSDPVQRLVDKLTANRFGRSHLADSAKTFLLEYLFDPDIGRFNGYQGKGAAEGYLKIVVRNAVETYAQSKLGKKVPPVWVKEKGDIWVRLWRELCLERRDQNDIVSRFSNLGHLSGFTLDALSRIRSRVRRCGCSDYIETNDSCSNDDDDQGSTHGIRFSRGDTIETSMQRSDVEALLEILSKVLSEEDHGKLQSELSSSFGLDDETFLILKMRLVSGLKISAIARSLGYTRYEIEKILNKGLDAIKGLLIKRGVYLDGIEFLDRIEDFESSQVSI